MDIALDSIGAPDEKGLAKLLTSWRSKLAASFKLVPTVKIASGMSASVAGNSFVVYHSGGKTPSFAVPVARANATVWATDSDHATWDSRKISLRCSVASTNVDVLLVFP